MSGDIEQIKRSHQSARPKDSNPAWKNTHRDLGVVLRELDHTRDEIRLLRAGLRFYANGRHMAFAEEARWDDVAEERNWLQRLDSDHYEMVENGSIAKDILCGKSPDWSEHDDGEPPAIEGEAAVSDRRECDCGNRRCSHCGQVPAGDPAVDSQCDHLWSDWCTRPIHVHKQMRECFQCGAVELRDSAATRPTSDDRSARMTEKTIYIHTIDGEPAVFDDEMICFAPLHRRNNRPAYSLRQIRREQRINDEYCQANGIDNAFRYGYIRYRVTTGQTEDL